MDTFYVISGWHTQQIQIRRSGPGIYTDPMYVRLSGNGEPPSPPENTSRAGVYRWLADLEDQGFETAFTKSG